MVSSRYQNSFGYGPRMGVGAYGSRNALAGIYNPPPPDGEIDEPIGLPEPEAEPTPEPAPRPEPAPTITNPPTARPDGNGVGFGGGAGDANDPGDGYGTAGPQGAPGSGNFGQDLGNFERATRNALGPMMALGPVGIPAAAIGTFALGALRALNPAVAARVAPAVLGYDADPTNDPSLGNPGDTPTPEGGNFGAGANVTGGNLADPGMVSTPDVTGSFGAIGPTSMDGITGNPDGALGNPGDFGTPAGGNFGDGANSDGGAGMNSGGDSNTSDGTAGMGSSESGNGRRYGGITRHDTDGVLDEVPIRAHENEYVVRPEATMHYGEDIMHALNSGMIPRNALMGLAMARKPTASNHLLQMMMR
jgi:hypothetical protein